MFGPKRTLKSLMRDLENGLRKGTIVLESTVPQDTLTWLPLASTQGIYQSYVGDPVATYPGQSRATRAVYPSARIMVVSGNPFRQMLRHALLQ